MIFYMNVTCLTEIQTLMHTILISNNLRIYFSKFPPPPFLLKFVAGGIKISMLSAKEHV